MSDSSVCCGTSAAEPSIGGISRVDFFALDVLVLKLLCLDSRFADPVRQLGLGLGDRIAGQQHSSPQSVDEALVSMTAACMTGGHSRVLPREGDDVRVQITGCSEACCPIPIVGRPVCSFNAGVFEGFLRQATGQRWAVAETACLGVGHAAGEFTIRLENASLERQQRARRDAR